MSKSSLRFSIVNLFKTSVASNQCGNSFVIGIGRRNYHSSSLIKFSSRNKFENSDDKFDDLLDKLKEIKSRGGASLNKRELQFFIQLKLHTLDLERLKKDIEEYDFQPAIEMFNKNIVEKSRLLEKKDVKVDMTKFSIKLGDFVREKNVKSQNIKFIFKSDLKDYENWDKERTLTVLGTPTSKNGAGLTSKEISFLKQFNFNGKVLKSIAKQVEHKTNDLQETLFQFFSKGNVKPTKKAITKIIDWVDLHLVEKSEWPDFPSSPSRKKVQNAENAENAEIISEEIEAIGLDSDVDVDHVDVDVESLELDADVDVDHVDVDVDVDLGFEFDFNIFDIFE